MRSSSPPLVAITVKAVYDGKETLATLKLVP
jgi:hypothetical protein